jgi:hypothetical protein
LVLVTEPRSWTPPGWVSTVQSSLKCRSQPAVKVVTDAEGVKESPCAYPRTDYALTVSFS